MRKRSLFPLLAFGAYRLALWLATPGIAAYLLWRAARGRETLERLSERWGATDVPRPAGTVIWLHAASVGELFSALPLVEALHAARADAAFLVTTGTRSSARLAAERLPARALHQFAPVDHPLAVRRFLRHWRPQAGLIVESELWPTLIEEAARAGCRLALVNGRISDRSYRKWRRAHGCARALLDRFALVLAQSDGDRARLAALGAPAPRALGNLKSAAPLLGADAAEVARFRQATAGRPLWIAASTHPGEDEIVVAAHRRLLTRHPDLLTIIVPRHPERGAEIAKLARTLGLGTARRSRGEAPAAETGIFVADSLGELGLWYRLAEIAFIGGSLVPHGGQNLLEAAKLGCAVLSGPHTENFREIACLLESDGALKRVQDESSLAAAVDALLSDSAGRAAAAAAAATSAALEQGVLAKVLAALEDRVFPASPSGQGES